MSKKSRYRNHEIRYPLPNKTEKVIKTKKDRAKEKDKRKTGRQYIEEYYKEKDRDD